ncbi:MAG: hypothetical protein Ct9H90mP30_5400 [Actinomycetota bacterium]|nr:MAG: hypothetical protein Ct9H90mP30_5400 [Actinomycetota bacterium]
MLRELYREKGWIPAPTLAGRDDPEHKEMRKLFAHAFRPQKIKKMDPFVENLANRLFEGFSLIMEDVTGYVISQYRFHLL